MISLLHEFEGWLKVLYIGVFVKLLISLVLLVFLFNSKSSLPGSLQGLYIFECIFNIVLFLNFLKLMRKKDSLVPDRLICLVWLYFFMSFVIWGVENWVAHIIDYHGLPYRGSVDSIGGGITFLYLYYSQKVKVYYSAHEVGRFRENLFSVTLNLLPNLWRK